MKYILLDSKVAGRICDTFYGHSEYVNYRHPKGCRLLVFASLRELAPGSHGRATFGRGSTLCGGLFQAPG